MIIALATIMLVWFGAQEALASAHGGAGFSMAKFLNLFMLLTFAYVLVAFYDSAIPHVGYSLKGFINGGAQYLVAVIGTDSVTTMQNALAQAQSTVGPGITSRPIADPYYALVFFFIQSHARTLRRHPQPDRWVRRHRQHRGGYVRPHHDSLSWPSTNSHFSSGAGSAHSSDSASTRL